MNRAERRSAAKKERRNIRNIGYGRIGNTEPSFNPTLSEQHRYFMDFIVFPEKLRDPDVLNLIIGGDADTIASLYDRSAYEEHYNIKRTTDFSVRREINGRQHMLYITMPKSDHDSSKVCTHIVITYIDEGKTPGDIRVFNIERSSMFGMSMTAIGEVSKACHANYGMAGNSDDENISRIWDIVNDEVDSEIASSF